MYKFSWLETLSQKQIREQHERFWNSVSKKAYPLTKGKYRIPISIEPFLMPWDEYESLRVDLLRLVSAATKITNRYYIDERVRKIVSMDDRELELVDSAKGQKLVGVVRLDLFYTKKPKVIEINADYPDGFFMHDITSREIISRSQEKHIKGFNHAEQFYRLLQSEGVSPESHIFIGYNRDRKFIDEFALSSQMLRGYGWRNISVGAFEELTYKNGRFYFQNKQIDVIRRGAELFKLRKIPGLMPSLIQAQAEGSVVIINNFKMRILGHKSLMAALHDIDLHQYLTGEEIKAVNTLLPLTLKLDRADIDSIIIQKDRWVLKPSDLAEGEKVAVGASLSRRDWKNSVSEARKNARHWIIQEKVDVPQTEFISAENEVKINRRVQKYDFDPHVVLYKDHAEMGGILVRFSESDILNVMQGGGLTYAFVKGKR